MIANFELKVKEFGVHLTQQTQQFEKTNSEIGQILKDKDARIEELTVQLKEGEAQNKAEQLQHKEKEVEEMNKKFGQLREEAKSRIKSLKVGGIHCTLLVYVNNTMFI